MDDDADPPRSIDGPGRRRSRHPVAVVLPLAAWTASLSLDLLSNSGGAVTPYARLSRDAMVIGLMGAAISGSLGLRDLVRYSPAHRPPPLGTFHAGLNLLAVAFYSIAAARRARTGQGRVSAADARSNVAALATLVVSGTLGGLLAKRFDVRPG